jgi:hypothetical protein
MIAAIDFHEKHFAGKIRVNKKDFVQQTLVLWRGRTA